MPRVHAEIPVLVKPSDEGYKVQPLFGDDEQVYSHVQLQQALRVLQRELQKMLQSQSVTRDNLWEVYRWLYNPDLRFEHLPYADTLGNQWVEGVFSVVTWEVPIGAELGKGADKQRLAWLPDLPEPLVVLHPDQEYRQQLQALLTERLRRLKRDEFESGFNPTDYLASGNEFLAEQAINADLRNGDLSFQQRRPSWLADMNEQPQFDGRHELRKVGHNLRDAYPDQLNDAWYRDVEVSRLQQLAFGERLRGVVIVGPTGSGRSTLLQAAYKHYLQTAADKSVKSKADCWHVEPNRIIAGMSVVGQWQRRLTAILEVGQKKAPAARPRLWIDNPIALLRVGKSASSDMTLSQVIKPYLEQQDLALILEATPEEWRVLQETDRGFADLLHVIRLEPTDKVTTARILLRKRHALERKHRCVFTPQALTKLYQRQQQLPNQQALPGALLEQTALLAKQHSNQHISAHQVERAMAQAQGLADMASALQGLVRNQALEEDIAKQLIGQPTAVNALANVLHTIKAGLCKPQQPRSVLLFIGPTGVGKTQAAKLLNQQLFAAPEQLLRFDMNEFISPYDAGRLVGDWRNPDGLLTAKVRHQPHCLLLLDEIEKAHPDIHDLLLQILGEGRLTDALGRTTDFSQCVIVLTSNLGAAEAAKQYGFQQHSHQASRYEEALKSFFRPELLNRIDQTVVFQPLTLEHNRAIARLELNKLLQRDGLLRRTTFLNVDEVCLDNIAQAGFAPELGGRALKRALEDGVAMAAARQLAQLPHSEPVSLQLHWHNGKPELSLVPFIAVKPHKSETALWISGQANLPAIQSRLQLIEQWQDHIFTVRDTISTDDPRYELSLSYQERLYPLKEQLSAWAWTLENQRSNKPSITPGGRTRVRFDAWREPAVTASEIHSQQDIADYLNDIHEQAQAIDINQDENWRLLNQTLALLQIQIEAGRELEHIVLNIKALQHISHRQYSAVWLASQIQKGLEDLGVVVSYQYDSQQAQLTASGFGLRQILAGELGVHLFHRSHQNALPILIELADSPLLQPASTTPQPGIPLIRHYRADDNPDHGPTLNDLRSGLSYRGLMTPAIWHRLWLNGQAISSTSSNNASA